MSLQAWRKSSNSLRSNRLKAVLVFSSLKTCDDVLHCFSIFWIISDIVFKADILPTCVLFDLSERKISLTSQTLSISAAVLITYRIQVLQNRKDLACETKTTVCKHKQKQMQPSSNRHKLIVQRSPIHNNI